MSLQPEPPKAAPALPDGAAPAVLIHRLSDCPAALDPVVRWIDEEWGAFSGRSREQSRARLAEERPDRLPRSFVAIEGGRPVGVASLRTRDSTDWDAAAGPWLCNVYVLRQARGRGIAGALCRHVESHAAALGFAALFLASIEGENSLYYRLGYRTYRTVRHDDEIFHLMRRALPAPGHG